MVARLAVTLTPPKTFHPSQLNSSQQSALVSPLAATLMDLPASVANKRLTAWLNPLDATFTKFRGVGVRILLPYLVTSLFQVIFSGGAPSGVN